MLAGGMDENTRQVLIYIQQQRDAGVADNVIMHHLQQVGWPPEIIQAAFTQANIAQPSAVRSAAVMKTNNNIKRNKFLVLIAAGVVALAIIGIVLALVLGGSGSKSDDAPESLSEEEIAEISERRQEDARSMIAALENYASNNNGRYPNPDPTGWQELQTDYLSDLADPQTKEAYKFTSLKPQSGEVQYVLGFTCTKTGGLVSGTPRSVVIRVPQEDTVFCVDNT